jgi:hypothetical protein
MAQTERIVVEHEGVIYMLFLDATISGKGRKAAPEFVLVDAHHSHYQPARSGSCLRSWRLTSIVYYRR